MENRAAGRLLPGFFECGSRRRSAWCTKAELSDQLIQRLQGGSPLQPMYYIGLDVHKKKLSYCVKVHSEGVVPATRLDLDLWMKGRQWQSLGCEVLNFDQATNHLESGREGVYLRSFPASPADGTKLRISRDGGRQPHWRGDGKEFFYLSLDRKILVVDVSDAGGVRLGAPTPLFQRPGTVEQSDFLSCPWDVTADGKRFLMGKTKKSSEPVTVMLNWSAELKSK